MTFKERLQKEHPDMIDPASWGGCVHCPHYYGYENRSCGLGPKINRETCEACWNREMPEEPVKEAKPETTKKTKASLIEELSKAKEKIDELKEEVARLERYSTYEKAGGEMYAMMTAFKNSGFTEEQAFALIKELSSAAMKK